jgi:hypothetical protein
MADTRIDRTHAQYWTPLDRPFRLETRVLPWQAAGRTWTASGYGARIPSTRVAVVTGPDGRTVARHIDPTWERFRIPGKWPIL